MQFVPYTGSREYARPDPIADGLDELALRLRKLAHLALMAEHGPQASLPPRHNVVRLDWERAKRRRQRMPFIPLPDPEGLPTILAMAWRERSHDGATYSARWAQRHVGCELDGLAYAPQWRKGTLYCAPGECVDMCGAIALFVEQFDPKVTKVETWSGDRPDTFYLKRNGRWHAYSPEWAHGCMCCFD